VSGINNFRVERQANVCECESASSGKNFNALSNPIWVPSDQRGRGPKGHPPLLLSSAGHSPRQILLGIPHCVSSKAEEYYYVSLRHGQGVQFDAVAEDEPAMKKQNLESERASDPRSHNLLFLLNDTRRHVTLGTKCH
jgi:hypothetical protein